MSTDTPDRATRDELQRMTVAQLREYAREHGMSSITRLTKKAGLVAAILAYQSKAKPATQRVGYALDADSEQIWRYRLGASGKLLERSLVRRGDRDYPRAAYALSLASELSPAPRARKTSTGTPKDDGEPERAAVTTVARGVARVPRLPRQIPAASVWLVKIRTTMQGQPWEQFVTVDADGEEGARTGALARYGPGEQAEVLSVERV